MDNAKISSIHMDFFISSYLSWEQKSRSWENYYSGSAIMSQIWNLSGPILTALWLAELKIRCNDVTTSEVAERWLAWEPGEKDYCHQESHYRG